MKTKLTITQWVAILMFFGISLATAYTPPTIPTLTCKVSGNTLTLSWQPLGSTLQTQTNRLVTGLGNNWVNVPGSQTTTNLVMTINPTNQAVFFRLVYF